MDSQPSDLSWLGAEVGPGIGRQAVRAGGDGCRTGLDQGPGTRSLCGVEAKVTKEARPEDV